MNVRESYSTAIEQGVQLLEVAAISQRVKMLPFAISQQLLAIGLGTLGQTSPLPKSRCSWNWEFISFPCATIFCACRNATRTWRHTQHPQHLQPWHCPPQPCKPTSMASKIDLNGLENWPCIRDLDHISGISYYMKSHSVPDQAKIDQVPGKTIYPMTM